MPELLVHGLLLLRTRRFFPSSIVVSDHRQYSVRLRLPTRLENSAEIPHNVFWNLGEKWCNNLKLWPFKPYESEIFFSTFGKFWDNLSLWCYANAHRAHVSATEHVAKTDGSVYSARNETKLQIDFFSKTNESYI